MNAKSAKSIRRLSRNIVQQTTPNGRGIHAGVWMKIYRQLKRLDVRRGLPAQLEKLRRPLATKNLCA